MQEVDHQAGPHRSTLKKDEFVMRYRKRKYFKFFRFILKKSAFYQIDQNDNINLARFESLKYIII